MASGAPVRRIGLLGGTFDPVHLGHLECAQSALEQLGLEEVVFMPAGVPSFKRDAEIAPAPDRLAMCRLACEGNDAFRVSSMECNREGVTFTIDTVREMLASQECEDDIFFIIGSDAFLTLPKWKSAGELVGLVTFAVLMRDGDSESAVLRVAESTGAKAAVVKAPRLDISSSGIRFQIAEGRSARYLVPEAVHAYIREHGLYGYGKATPAEADDEGRDSAECAACKPFSPEFQECMREKLKGRVSEKRLAHIDGVAETARELAIAYGEDVDKAFLAGLLHDWDKGLSDEEIQERCRSLGIVDEVGPWVVDNMPQVGHGPTAAAALAREYPDIPPDVIHAIKVHTTGCTEMSPLDKIIYVADAIEPGRKFKKLPDLRAMIGKASLDELFFEVYKFWTIALVERGIVLHPDTTRIWNAYAASNPRWRIDGKKEKKRFEGKPKKRKNGGNNG